MNLKNRISFVADTIAKIAPALSQERGAAHAIARGVLAELVVWRELNPVDEPAEVAALEKHAATAKAHAEANAAKAREAMDKKGPELWREWHLRALNIASFDVDMNRGGDWDYIRSLAERITCPACRANFARHLKDHPPKFGLDGFDYFEWTVMQHNLVRAEQGKEQMSVEEARLIYSNLS